MASSQLSGLLAELQSLVSSSGPQDVLQFCADFFNDKLQQERLHARSDGLSSLGHQQQQQHPNVPVINTSQLKPSGNSRSPAGVSAGPSSSTTTGSKSTPITPIIEEGYDPADSSATARSPRTTQRHLDQHPPSSSARHLLSSPTQSGFGKTALFGVGGGQAAAAASSSSTSNANNTSNGFTSEEHQQQGSQLQQRGGEQPDAAADFPPNYNLARRTSVSAESLAPSTSYNSESRKMIPKSANQRARIVQSIQNNLLFKNLDEEQTKEVLDAMEEKKVEGAGRVIIKQGDVGDFFYVVETGAYDVFIRHNGMATEEQPQGRKVATIGPGGSFGELALMYNAPRAATVATTVDTTHSTLWALDRMTFRRILMELTYRKRRMYEKFLETVPLLKTLESYERQKIADALEAAMFEQGEDVIRQGDVGEMFYLVESGEASVIVNGKVEAQLKRGDYFGGRCLQYIFCELANNFKNGRYSTTLLAQRPSEPYPPLRLHVSIKAHSIGCSDQWHYGKGSNQSSTYFFLEIS